jgi:hypothetical protein
MPGGSFKKWAIPVAEEGQSLMHGTYNLAKRKIVSHVLTPFRCYDTQLSARRKGRPQLLSFPSLWKQSTLRR